MRENLDVVLAKIGKLMRLAKSQNPHEAALAMARAAELMAKYQISEAALGVEEERTVAGIEIAVVRRASPHLGAIAKGLEFVLDVKIYMERERSGVRANGKPRFVMRFAMIGRESDAKAARYMFEMLRHEIDRLAECGFRAVDHARRVLVGAKLWKSSFRLGAAETIFERLEQQAKERDHGLRAAAAGTDEARALVVLDRRRTERERVWVAITRLAREMGQRTETRTFSQTVERLAMAEGREAGKTVDLGGPKPGLPSGALRLPGKVGS